MLLSIKVHSEPTYLLILMPMPHRSDRLNRVALHKIELSVKSKMPTKQAADRKKTLDEVFHVMNDLLTTAWKITNPTMPVPIEFQKSYTID